MKKRLIDSPAFVNDCPLQISKYPMISKLTKKKEKIIIYPAQSSFFSADIYQSLSILSAWTYLLEIVYQLQKVRLMYKFSRWSSTVHWKIMISSNSMKKSSTKVLSMRLLNTRGSLESSTMRFLRIMGRLFQLWNNQKDKLVSINSAAIIS